jgi:hypothetical protein
MSRSYKKYPIVRQERIDPRISNRYIRHHLDVDVPMKGSRYKRMKFGGWNWAYRWSLEDAKKTYYEREYFQQKYSTLEEYLIWYKKTVLSK